MDAGRVQFIGVILVGLLSVLPPTAAFLPAPKSVPSAGKAIGRHSVATARFIDLHASRQVCTRRPCRASMSMGADEWVQDAVLANRMGVLTLNRAKALNAADKSMTGLFMPLIRLPALLLCACFPEVEARVVWPVDRA